MPTDTTFEEQYVLNYFDSLRMLKKEQEALRRAAISAELPDAERAAAAAAFLDITSKIAAFEDVHEALMLKFMMGNVPPPSQALVSETQRLETKLGEYLAKQTKYSAILAGVTEFLSAWTSLTVHPVGAAATGGQGAAAGTASHLAFLGHK